MATPLERHAASHLTETHRLPRELRIEPTPRWVRVFLGGLPVADSKRVLLAFEPGRYPEYWFPQADVRMDLLLRTHQDDAIPRTQHYSVQAGGKVAEDGAWSYPDPGAGREALAGHVAFVWDRMDAWFEEDDEVFFHPRHPYQRVDVLHSSRHVRIEVDGDVVADTRRPTLLFETGLPTRFYIPKLDVRMELLEPSDKTSVCPYKGTAVYWSLRIGEKVFEDFVWSYRAPIPECPKIENLLAFFNEKVDITVDDELLPRPVTPW